MVTAATGSKPANPTNLPPRYEIRALTTPQHEEWARAIVSHSNTFNSPVWSHTGPSNRARCLSVFTACAYLMQHQIDSGLSYGVFDTEYAFKRPESAAVGGRLYWLDQENENGTSSSNSNSSNSSNSTSTTNGEEDAADDAAAMLAEMDFPLVSVAMAYDGHHPLDRPQLAPLITVLPEFGIIHTTLAGLDKRDPASWKPQAPGEVLMRASTCTRADYAGKGLMGELARWMMRDAAARGFRGVQIDPLHDAVKRVWAEPPAPFRGEVVASFRTDEFKTVGEDGVMCNPFGEAVQEASKVWVTLK